MKGKDKIQRCVAYFQTKTGPWPRKLIWFTGDYFNIKRPLCIAFVLYVIFLICWQLDTMEMAIPFYKILAVMNLEKDTLQVLNDIKLILCAALNILRRIFELSICFLALSLAMKKRLGMSNPKEFSSSPA